MRKYERKKNNILQKSHGCMLRRAAFFVVLVIFCLCAAGCSGDTAKSGGAPQIEGLTYADTVQTQYADQFTIYRYEEGHYVIEVKDDTSYLVVPEDAEAPQEVPEGITVIKQSPENVYLGATSAMALFGAIDAMDEITMTELKESGWSIPEVRNAMQQGDIVYAGKYSQPDYEFMLSKKCDLAVESTMIYHTPEVKEMLEDLGIPVFVDRSSLESSPLGRTEWALVYGVITNRLDEAKAFMEKQQKKIEGLDGLKNTEKKVAFFYITTSGKVMVRTSTDYIPAMIEMAGGRYVPAELTADEGHSQVGMTLESFYEEASDADILIYNTNIDDTVKTRSDLLDKSDVFENFKAVKEGECYTSGSSFYQQTDKMSDMIVDLHKVIKGEPEDLQFLTKME